jgi:hypothetical protein
MCLGCGISIGTYPMELMKNDEKFRVGLFLKMHGWKETTPVSGQFTSGSGGSLLYGEADKPFIPREGGWEEVAVPTIKDIMDNLPEGFLENPSNKWMIDKFFDNQFHDSGLSLLEKWAQLWAASQLQIKYQTWSDEEKNLPPFPEAVG